MDDWQRKLTLILAYIAELQIILPALSLVFSQQMSPKVSEIDPSWPLSSELLVDLAMKCIIAVFEVSLEVVKYPTIGAASLVKAPSFAYQW